MVPGGIVSLLSSNNTTTSMNATTGINGTVIGTNASNGAHLADGYLVGPNGEIYMKDKDTNTLARTASPDVITAADLAARGQEEFWNGYGERYVLVKNTGLYVRVGSNLSGDPTANLSLTANFSSNLNLTIVNGSETGYWIKNGNVTQ
jgi:hypothetical protein